MKVLGLNMGLEIEALYKVITCADASHGDRDFVVHKLQ